MTGAASLRSGANSGAMRGDSILGISFPASSVFGMVAAAIASISVSTLMVSIAVSRFGGSLPAMAMIGVGLVADAGAGAVAAAPDGSSLLRACLPMDGWSPMQWGIGNHPGYQLVTILTFVRHSETPAKRRARASPPKL